MGADRDTVRFMARALSRISANVQRARRRRPGAGVLALLEAVEQVGSAKPSELADHLGLTRAAVTRQIQQLLAEDALVTTPDPADRRSFSVALSPKGREQLAALDARGVSRFVLFTQDWSDDEVRQLGELLEKLEASIAAAVRGEPALTRPPWRRPQQDARPTDQTGPGDDPDTGVPR